MRAIITFLVFNLSVGGRKLMQCPSVYIMLPSFTLHPPPPCRRLHQEVTLPTDFTCDRCVLQLLRQAGEWAAPGGGYVFWSCADISIVDVDSPGKMCCPCVFINSLYKRMQWLYDCFLHFAVFTSQMWYVVK